MDIVVYIGGWLVPKEGYVPIPIDLFPRSVKVIPVFPSGGASLHDRVMNIFYELKGGQVHFGEDHGKFHGHSVVGDFYEGKFKSWDAKNPVHIVGHSYGGLTALCLQHYISSKNKFSGHETNEKWIASVTTIDSPLNGSLMVYSLGANTSLGCGARWGSTGCLVGWTAHIFGYLNFTFLNRLYDFQLGHWALNKETSGSIFKLMNAMLGVCVHTTTDNSAYDMTIQSQLVWGQYFTTHPHIYYLCIVGNSYASTPWYIRLLYSLPRWVLRRMPTRIAHLDTSSWSSGGFDGLLTTHDQSPPCLHPGRNPSRYVTDTYFADDVHDDEVSDDHVSAAERVSPGMWVVVHRDMDHLGFTGWRKTWTLVSDAIQVFVEQRSRRVAMRAHPPGGDAALNSMDEDEKEDDEDANLGYPPNMGGGGRGCPDMQCPQWSYVNRPVSAVTVGEVSSVFFAYMCVLGHAVESDATGFETYGNPVIGTLMVCLYSGLMAVCGLYVLGRRRPLTSDHSQGIFASARLMFLVISTPLLVLDDTLLGDHFVRVGAAPPQPPLVLLTVGYVRLFVMEWFTTLALVKPLEFRCTVLTALLALCLVTRVKLDRAHDDDGRVLGYALVFVLFDMMTIIPKFAWWMCALERFDKPSMPLSRQIVWFMLWCSLLFCIFIVMSSCVWSGKNVAVETDEATLHTKISIALSSILPLPVVVICLQKIRDLSDSYQTFSLLSSYSVHRKNE